MEMAPCFKRRCGITESVDSICRPGIAQDTQYTLTQKISQISKTVNLCAFITTYRSSSSVFMMNNMPSGAKKHHESTYPESYQMAKMFIFSSSSDRLVQNWRFQDGFCTKKVTKQLWLHLPRHFLNTCMHVHKSLSKEMLMHNPYGNSYKIL